jgi:phospholipase C
MPDDMGRSAETMRSVNRRRFLGTATSALAAAGLASLPPSLRRALAAAEAEPPRRGSLQAIEHVVIFMQENRSFDTYFGTLSGVRGFDDPTAIRLSSGRSVFYQPDLLNSNGYELPFHMDTGKTSAQCVADLSHEWVVQHTAWHGGRMDGWLTASRAANGPNGPLTMGYYTRADLPFHYALADAFTICDNYHCSVLGPTNPNRLYLWTATIDPDGKNGGPVIDNSETPPYTWTTYPERLQAAGISWRVYQQADNYDDNALAWFKQYQQAPTTSPLYQNGMVKRAANAFQQDVASDNLPQVSWIIAPTAQSEHPSNMPAAGADLTSSYLEALASNAKVWAKTAFFLCYDENDGFFDHVPPPVALAGTPGEYITTLVPPATSGGIRGPIGLGFRVPMIVISPFSVGGWVCNQTFDHTSLIRFLEARFGVQEPNISAWRRRACGDLTAAFDFRHANASFPRLPATGPQVLQAQQGCSTLPPPSVPAVQTMPHQETQPPRRHR